MSSKGISITFLFPIWAFYNFHLFNLFASAAQLLLKKILNFSSEMVSGKHMNPSNSRFGYMGFTGP